MNGSLIIFDKEAFLVEIRFFRFFSLFPIVDRIVEDFPMWTLEDRKKLSLSTLAAIDGTKSALLSWNAGVERGQLSSE